MSEMSNLSMFCTSTSSGLRFMCDVAVTGGFVGTAMDDADFDELLETFIRKPNEPRPEWALDPNKSTLEQLQQLPFFMTTLPDNFEDNVQLQALQALLYEGTDEEIAANFKERGNEAFKLGSRAGYMDALVLYTKGLDLRCNDVALNAQLWANRAAAQYSLGNYGFCVKDAVRSLALNPENAKCYWRAASAAMALKKYQQAGQFCSAGLQRHPESSELARLQDTIALHEAQHAQEDARLEQGRLKKAALIKAFTARGMAYTADAERLALLELGPGVFGSNHPTAALKGAQLHLPLIFMYPPAGQFDVIEAANEADTLLDHVCTVFESPAPWDANSLYCNPCEMVAYVREQLSAEESSSPSIIYKVPLDTALSSLFGVVIKAVELGIVTVYILPNATAHETLAFEQKFRVRRIQVRCFNK